MRLRRRLQLSIRAFRLSGRNRELRLVQLARLASVTGRWAYTVTLAVYAYRLDGAGGVALAGIVRLAPAAVAAPFAGAVVRRLPLGRREPFLAVVTGNRSSAEAADAVVGARLGLRGGFTAA